jgi:hypothetical protein
MTAHVNRFQVPEVQQTTHVVIPDASQKSDAAAGSEQFGAIVEIAACGKAG